MLYLLLYTVIFILVALASLTALLFIGNTTYQNHISTLQEKFLTSQKSTPQKIITEEDIKNFPDPIKRYLYYSQVVGKPLISRAEIMQKGEMRLDAEQPWLPFTAHQYITTYDPGFIWNTTVNYKGIPLFKGVDTYRNGHGAMQIKVGGLIPVVDAIGKEVDHGTMLRYLGEIVWVPTAFLSANIKFEQINFNCVKVIFNDTTGSVYGTLCIDDVGKPIEFIAKRYREVNGEYKLYNWKVQSVEFGQFNTYQVPVKHHVIWETETGDFEWLRLQITNITYN